LQTLNQHKFGINAGLKSAAKVLLRPAVTATVVAPIVNADGREVDSLHMVTRGDGQSFVEVVDRTVDHRGGFSVFFLALVDRFGRRVPASAWSDAEVRDALLNLEDSGAIGVAVRLNRGASPPTSFMVH
jgi:hypothetical protein